MSELSPIAGESLRQAYPCAITMSFCYTYMATTSTSPPPSHLPHLYHHLRITSSITSNFTSTITSTFASISSSFSPASTTQPSPPPSPPPHLLPPYHLLQHLPPTINLHHPHLLHPLTSFTSTTCILSHPPSPTLLSLLPPPSPHLCSTDPQQPGQPYLTLSCRWM